MGKLKCEICGINPVKNKILLYTDLVNTHKIIYLCEECTDIEIHRFNTEFGFSITTYNKKNENYINNKGV